jgi:cyclopropane-fatty-acyl-phospholipid synthase
MTKELKKQIDEITNQINLLNNKEKSTVLNFKFTYACPIENCKGFLDAEFYCAICSSNICNKCYIKINDESFYIDLILKRSLGLGEAYMDQKFTTPNLELLITKLTKLHDIKLTDISFKPLYILIFIYYLFDKFYQKSCAYLFNQQTIAKSKKVAEIHYDLPEILYDSMLDTTKLYSCAYFEHNSYDLFQAQKAKAQLIISKLKIEDGHEILEIGSGWGYIASEIAIQFPKSNVLGITISFEQYLFCIKKYVHLTNLKFKMIDYRQLYDCGNKYDRVVSCGTCEHLGDKNYHTFFQLTYDLLKNDGLTLVHMITNPNAYGGTGDPWIRKYIFPGGYLPKNSRIISVVEEIKQLKLVDVQEFGFYYGKTLGMWYDNFSKNWDTLVTSHPHIFTEKFKLMWEFYLKSCKIQFELDRSHLTQFVFTKNFKKIYTR